MKRIIKPTPTPSAGVTLSGKPVRNDGDERRARDAAAESLYFLELLLLKLGIDRGGKPMSFHTFTRKHFRV